MLTSKEHYEIMEQFERQFKPPSAHEDKQLWNGGNVYQDGRTNELFKMFRAGVAYGKFLYQSGD